MNNSTPPVKIYTAFAQNATAGYITAVPQTTAVPGAFSWSLGSGPETFIPPGSGGTAPLGDYFNGLQFQITDNLRWIQAGGWFKYDATFASNIGGYPNQAIILKDDASGFYVSTVDNNMSNPNTGGANWTVMTPNTYPWSQITGAPSFVLNSAFTGSNQNLVTNGYQKYPGGLMEQWMDVFVPSALNTTVNITFPIPFPASPGVVFTPTLSIIDTNLSGAASNALLIGLSGPPTLTGCTAYLGANGGGARNVTLHVEVKGRWA